VEYMQRVADAIIEGGGLRKALSWDNLGTARVRLFKDHKFRPDGISRFWFQFYPSHKLPPPKAGRTRFRSRDLLFMY
jgi:hypothetical protein